MMNLRTPSNLFILNNLAERVGFEFTRKRSFNNIERTAGSVKQWKTVLSSANGSQTDHKRITVSVLPTIRSESATGAPRQRFN